MGMPEDQEAREGTEDESDFSEASLSHRSGTRHMGKHTGLFFDGLDTFLKARVGGKKSDRSTKGIVVNVAKYLYWCDASTVEPLHLLKANKIREYIEGLEVKVGPSGLQQHISDIEAALRYSVNKIEGASNEVEFVSRAESTFRKLKDFRASFRGEKSKRERARLEDLAENLPETSDVITFLPSDESF